MEQRNEWVDYAKAIGIILVVYGHVARGVFNADIAIPQSFYAITDSIIYSFHMPLFFFLSGLFFMSSLAKRGGFKLTLSKIDTVFYPFIVWSILQGSIEVFLSNYTNGSLSFAEVFSFLWAPRGQFWFLYALFFIFIFAAILFFCLQKILKIKTDKIASACIFILAIVLYLYPTILPDNVVFRYLGDNFVFFAFGILFTQFYRAEQLATYVQLLLMACLFIIAQVIFHFILDMNYANKGSLSLLLALVSILFITSLSLYLAKKPNKIWIYIGTSSMAIYLMHILAGSGIRVIMKSFLGIDSYIVHLVAGTVVGLLAPLLALWFIKRLHIPYLFSAPLSKGFLFVGDKFFKRSL